MSENDTLGAFMAGFVVGGLAGAAAALLLAPQSGEETRAQIQQQGIELQARAQETLGEARKKADELITEAKEQGKVVLQEQKAKVEEGIKIVEEKIKKEEPAAEPDTGEA